MTLYQTHKEAVMEICRNSSGSFILSTFNLFFLLSYFVQFFLLNPKTKNKINIYIYIYIYIKKRLKCSTTTSKKMLKYNKNN